MNINILLIVVTLVAFGAGTGVGFQVGSKSNKTVSDQEHLTEKKVEISHSVAWMLQPENEDETLKIYRDCLTNPGLLSKTANCINTEHLMAAADKARNYQLMDKLVLVKKTIGE